MKMVDVDDAFGHEPVYLPEAESADRTAGAVSVDAPEASLRVALVGIDRHHATRAFDHEVGRQLFGKGEIWQLAFRSKPKLAIPMLNAGRKASGDDGSYQPGSVGSRAIWVVGIERRSSVELEMVPPCAEGGGWNRIRISSAVRTHEDPVLGDAEDIVD
ncbi:MAG TPA: hypothetical protein VLK66_15150 [Longimicrobium sp.]|nr:hypothetical protein [Longimicrobium sp.]